MERPGDRAALRAELARERSRQIERLHAYAEAGVFPTNRERPGMLNVFIDDEGHLCAAANLLALAGKRDLVERTASESNFIRLADVQSGPLFDWILHSGLTQEEVALIQEPYAFIEPAIDPNQLDQEKEREKQRLQRHFRVVEQRLIADADRSLDLAVDRLIARL